MPETLGAERSRHAVTATSAARSRATETASQRSTFLKRALAWYQRNKHLWPPAHVNRLRRALGLVENGAIDEDLVGAVARFQRERGLSPVDGVAGRETLGAILGGEVPPATKEVADAITSAFEGGRYDTLQTYDAGVVSYGKHQTTLASGNLAKLLERYLNKAEAETPVSPVAKALRGYLPRVRARDEALRRDSRFHDLLRKAAKERPMEEAQDEFFEDNYWKPAVNLALTYGIRSPLGFATFYDCLVQGGAEVVAEGTRKALGGIVGAQVRRRREDGSLHTHTITEPEFLLSFNKVRENRLEALAQEARRAGDKQTASALRNSKVRPQAFAELARAGNLDLRPNVGGTNQLELKHYAGARIRVKGRTQ